MALPVATHELNSNTAITLSGTSVTAWGDATADLADAPTYSADADDRILNYPAIKFNGTDEYMQWNAIAAMLSGDDPDFTAAILIRANASGGNFLCTGNDSNGEVRVGINATPDWFWNRIDDTNASDSGGIATASASVPYLVVIKCAAGLGQMGAWNLDADTYASGSGSIAGPAVTMLYGAIGSRIEANTDAGHCNCDIARIRLYDSALTGDLAGDLSGTQIEELAAQMRSPLGSSTLRRGKYFIGLGIMHGCRSRIRM